MAGRTDRVLVVLTALAVASRLLWVLWAHPPHEYVWSDMERYLERAIYLLGHGIESRRTFAWQTWGTHTLMALPLGVFGTGGAGRWAANVGWGAMGAACVPLTYLVAQRALRVREAQADAPQAPAWLRFLPAGVGVVALLWYPHLSMSGFYLAETPFCFLQLLATYWFIEVAERGRRPLAAGTAAALAFAVRPQIAIFCLCVLGVWALHRRQLPRVGARQLALIAIPLVVMLGFSLGRFTFHTGYCCGIAENANMNFTAGRCHNVVTQAFKSKALLARSDRRRSTKDGRRVSLPSFRRLARKGDDHPLALRPAMDHTSIKLVGYIGDPGVHREIRRECYRRTGVLEQVRYSAVNVSLLWFFSAPWPDVSEGKRRKKTGRWPPAEVLIGTAETYRIGYAVVFLVPSVVGMGLALGRLRRRDPPMALVFVALQMTVSLAVAALFFGTPRLRAPYDPFAFILAAYALQRLVTMISQRQ